MIHNIGRTARTLTTAIAIGLMAAACHSSKSATSNSQSTTTPAVKPDYNGMRQDVGGRRYDIKSINDLIAEASRWLGVPYLYAGHSTEGTDCSGLVMEVFQKVLNVKLPRSSAQQQQYCSAIARETMLPGDLVFFATGSDPARVSHVGLYIGDGDMIHASSSRGVIVSHLSERYYTQRFHSAGRVEAVDRLYSEAKSKKSGKASEQQTTEPLQPTGGNNNVAVPTISIDDVITEKVDSIYNGFLD
jgi:lipoprotein Spr